MQRSSILEHLTKARIADADPTRMKYAAVRSTIMVLVDLHSAWVDNEEGVAYFRSSRDQDIQVIEQMCIGLTTVIKPFVKFGPQWDNNITKVALICVRARNTVIPASRLD